MGRISDERKAQLEEIGVQLRNESIHATWEDHFAELLAYKDEHGHIDVPQKHLGLGRWVNKQRQSARDGDMSVERKMKLDDIGFLWNKNKNRKHED